MAKADTAGRGGSTHRPPRRSPKSDGSGGRANLGAAILGAAALGTVGYLSIRNATQPASRADWRNPSPDTSAEEEPGAAARGRRARAPTQMPAPAWQDIFWRVKAAIARDRVLIVAAGVTFYAILSLFPMIAAFVALYGLFADRSDVEALIEGLEGAVPEELLTLVSEQLERLMEVEAGTLTLTSLVALAIAFWSANGGVKGMIEAMNVAYNEHDDRSFIKLNLTAMSMTLGGMVMVATLIALSAVVPVVVALFPGGGWRDALLLWGRWPVMAGLLVLVLAVLFRFGPDRRSAKWRWITPGAVFAAVGMIVVSAGFSFYTSNFAAYGETYGSLGTVVVVMMWFWLTSIVVILGAEINAEIEHQTAQDSTIGPDRPMGEREAVKADNVAPPPAGS
jgi:membrane protein